MKGYVERSEDDEMGKDIERSEDVENNRDGR